MRRLPTIHRSIRAFTLIELLVVIVILGILMAVAVPTFLKQQSKAQDSRTQQYLTTAFKAIRAGTPENGNTYPNSTSLVSWIKQSEPELTAQRGSCTNGVQSAPQDAVLVDPSSTSNALILCARSQSGNVWKLTASATGAQQLLDGTLIPFTFSGGEITDTVRASQGDGLSSDSSTGIWEATTNLIPNGGGEANTTHVFQTGSGTTTITQTTSTAKFGHASFQTVTDGTTAGPQGIKWYDATDHAIAVTVGQTYTFSVWAKGAAGGEALTATIGWYDSSLNSIGGGASTPGTATTSWQRWSVTATAPAGAAYVYFALYTTNPHEAVTYYADGAQFEQKSYPTPYVETSSATGTRVAGRVTVSTSSVLPPTQGWVAARVRPSYPSSATAPNARVFWLAPDNTGSNRLSLGLTTNLVQLISDNGGTDFDSLSASWNAGDVLTVIGAWTATNLYVSVNGSAFQSVPRTHIPSGSLTLDIGSQQTAGWLDGDVLWLATGTGTLTNTDAATINSWGSTDPKLAQFPSSAQATMAWNGTSSSGSLK